MTEDKPTVIITMPPPPSLNRLWIHTPGKPRVKSPDYRKWIETAGWIVKMQIVGMTPLDCRYNLTIEVPISRRDTGNWEKALCDLCERVGVVTNDGNAHEITITPSDRADCVLRFTPLPDMGAIRKAAKVSTRPMQHKPTVKTSSLAWARRNGVWRP